MKRGIPVGIITVVVLCAMGTGTGRAAITSPTNISDCVLWLDGDDIDGDGTAEDGGETYGGTWTDKSGNGYDAENATAGQQPALTVGGINGRTTLTWDDVDDYLTIDAGSNGKPLDSSLPLTAFMVVEHSAPVDHKTLFNNGGGAGNNDGAYLRNEGGIQIIRTYAGSGGSLDSPTSNPIGFGTNLWMWRIEDTHAAGSGDFDVRQDGVLVASADLLRGTASASDDIIIGRSLAYSCCGLDGQIAEFILYERALTASEISDVGNYVKTKWGIPVNTPDLSGSPSTVTNLELWLDAADIDGDGTDEGAGETYAGVWNDCSGNGRNATQSTGSQQPVVTPNGLNSRTTLLFDGVDDLFDVTDRPLRPDTPFTAIFVCQWAAVLDAVFFINDGASGDKDGARLLSNGADQDLRIFGPNPDPDIDFIPSFSGEQEHIVVLQNSAVNGTPGTYTVDLDGSNVNSLAYTRSASTVGAISLGALSGGTSSFDGEWGEVLIYSRVLTSDELNTVGFYQQDKWGISGSYTDPSGPTPASGTVIVIR